MAGAHVAPARHGEHCIGGMRTQLTLWSNAGVFVRVWEYEVPGDRAEAFAAAYAADGVGANCLAGQWDSWARSCTATLAGPTVR